MRNTSRPTDDLPHIWVVSITRLARLFRDVTPEFDDQARIEAIDLGFEEAVREVRKRLRRQSCDVILAAGSNGAYLKARVDVPVVLVESSGFDVMAAMVRARKLSPHVALVTHQNAPPEFSAFADSFGLEVQHRVFSTHEDARDVVAELAALGVDVVVGTGLVSDVAEAAGLKSVLLYSASSVRTGFAQALSICQATRNPASARPTLAARAPRPRPPGSTESLLGTSAVMQQLRAQIAACAPTQATVLLLGETGTGKELAARALHAQGLNPQAPFVAVNCGALAESLLEAELFGHEEGAFTGARRGGRPGLIEAAAEGTLFLDEIGELPQALQSRLLRVIEQRELLRVGGVRPVPVRCRILAATHRNLAEESRAGRFRQALYYRLDVLRLQLPPLRAHPEDIPLLGRELPPPPDRSRPQLSAEAEDCLKAYAWPGNVRELRNVLDRLAYLQSGHTVDAATLRGIAPEVLGSGPARPQQSPVARRTRGQPDRAGVETALQACGGDRHGAAQLLGVSRTTLWRWMKQLGLA